MSYSKPIQYSVHISGVKLIMLLWLHLFFLLVSPKGLGAIWRARFLYVYLYVFMNGPWSLTLYKQPKALEWLNNSYSCMILRSFQNYPSLLKETLRVELMTFNIHSLRKFCFSWETERRWCWRISEDVMRKCYCAALFIEGIIWLLCLVLGPYPSNFVVTNYLPKQKKHCWMELH